MYDPTVGEFIEEDPIGFDAHDENLYRYCENGPTMATDPTGLDPAQKTNPSELNGYLMGNYGDVYECRPGQPIKLIAPPRSTPPDASGLAMERPAPRTTPAKSTLGEKIASILLARLDEPLRYDKKLYLLNDDLGEMAGELKGHMNDFKRLLAMGLVQSASLEEKNIDGTSGSFQRLFADVMPLMHEMKWEVIAHSAFDTNWWLGGARQVRAYMKFDYRISHCGAGYKVTMSHMDNVWAWYDRIEGRTLKQWLEREYRAPGWWKTIPGGLLEGAARGVNELLGLSFDIRVQWHEPAENFEITVAAPPPPRPEVVEC